MSRKKKKIYLSIIIPSYNEAENFKKGSLNKVAAFLKDKFKKTYEVIIVDDGSEDETRALISNFIKNKPNWQLVKNTHQGKPETVATGIKKAKGKYVLYTDFDQATPISEIFKLLDYLKEDFNVIIGSREIKGAKREKEPFYRHVMGKVFNIVVRTITIPEIQDTQCGFKLFDTKIAKLLFSKLIIYKNKKTQRAFTGAFDVEILFLAKKFGFKIAEVPIHWQYHHTKRVDPIRDSIKMFIDVLRIKLYDLLGKYENK